MKTLYISDLDGTLLNSEARLSEFSRNTLNRLIQQGLQFSIATARTPVSTLAILEGVQFSIPMVLMNGAVIYDPVKQAYLKAHLIGETALFRLLDLVKQHSLEGFLYTLENGVFHANYESLNTTDAQRFYEERIETYGKAFRKTASFYDCKSDHPIYFTLCSEHHNLLPIYEAACKINESTDGLPIHEAANKMVESTDGLPINEAAPQPHRQGSLHLEFYNDVYDRNIWYLEASSPEASKYNGLRYIQKEFGFEKTIAFGDNLNDLSLFAASDEGYAVANAKPPLKEKATAVIAGNNEDGVAKWLLQHANSIC